MKRIAIVPTGVAIAAATILFVAPVAIAQTTADEGKCQLATSLSLGKFAVEKMKCISECENRAFSDPAVAPECVPPYGAATAGCITNAENNGTGLIQSGCAKDCPECYTGGDCATDAQTRISGAELDVEALAGDVFCDDSGSADGLTLSEHKCQMTVAKFLSQFTMKKLKCYSRCRKAELAGKLPPGSCTPPASDPKTAECISKVEQKAASLIDNKCESSLNPSADKPECGVYPTTDGAGRVAAQEGAVDAMHAGLFCTDP